MMLKQKMLSAWTSHQDPTDLITPYYNQFSALSKGASPKSTSGIPPEIFIVRYCKVNVIIYK